MVILLLLNMYYETNFYLFYFCLLLEHLWLTVLPFFFPQNVSSRCYMTGHKVLLILPNSWNLIVALMSLFNQLLDKTGYQCQGFLM